MCQYQQLLILNTSTYSYKPVIGTKYFYTNGKFAEYYKIKYKLKVQTHIAFFMNDSMTCLTLLTSQLLAFGM